MVSRFFFILIFLLSALNASAQLSDTTKQNLPVADTLRQPLNKINSLSENQKKKIERINSKLEKQRIRFKNRKIKKDSIQSTAQGEINKPQEAEQKLESKLNSVEKRTAKAPEEEVTKYNQKVQVLRKHFNHYLDSLENLPTKDTHVAKSMDNLKKKMKHLKEAKSVKEARKGEEKLAKLQSGLNSKVKGFEGKVSKELGEINKLGANVKVPNVNVPNVNLPNANVPNINLPKTNILNTNLGLNTNLPKVNTPTLDNPNLPSGNLSIPGVSQSSLPSTSNLPGNVLPKNELGNLGKETSQLTQSTAEINKVQGGVKNLNAGTLEKEAQNIKEVKQLGGETAQAEQYKKIVEKWNSDPDYQKEMLVSKAKEQAINHFAGQEKQLTAAMQQLTNVKNKYKGYEGALDMFKKPGNAMKEKPFVERLRPGFNLQIQEKRETLIDFNPQLGYRITGGLTAGMGWNERWGYDFNKWNYNCVDHIYGPRAYLQVKVNTSIYALVAPEVMNALVPPFYNSPDPGTRKWVWSWMAGIKKETRYSKNVMGSMLVMYNLFDKHNQSPYVSKLNIRIGFEFLPKKKK